jgi:hypothetical protein
MNSRADVQQVLDGVQTRIRERGWSGVTQEDRDAANVDAFYGCVLNGGIDSLFFNSPYLGDMSAELLASLERAGAVRAATIVREAFALFPEGRVPATLESRVDWLRGLKEAAPFEEITRRFHDEAENEETVLSEFFRKHPKHFGSQFQRRQGPV